MIKKYISLFLIISICIVPLTGCYDLQNIDDLSYVVGFGIDSGKNNTLKISFQISKPESVSESGNSNKTSQSSSTEIYSLECASINSGINLMNSYISRKINLSHCKVIVISEELASKGIGDYIYSLMNNIQIRPDSNIIISKCSPEYYLKNSASKLEEKSAKYYEIIPASSEYTGYTINIELKDFFSKLNDTFSEPYAILGNINTTATQDKQDNILNRDKDSSNKAGDSLGDEKPNLENVGMAVFNGDTIVGELNAIETVCHLILTNKLSTCNFIIPSPFNNSETIDIYVSLLNSTKNKVTLINGTPFIECNIKLKARILSMNEKSNYLNTNNINKIENSLNSYLEKNVSNFLYKTSKEFKSDIIGFGRYIVKDYLTWDDWLNSNWLNNYSNAFFKVNVNSDIKSGILLLET